MRLKVFIACALGGGVGALIALQLTPFFWWIGVLFGGLVGYLSYEFKTVMQAASIAWRMAGEGVPNLLRIVFSRRLLKGLIEVVTILLNVFIVLLPLGIAAFIAISLSGADPMKVYLPVILISLTPVFLVGMVGPIIFADIRASARTGKEHSLNLGDTIVTLDLLYFNFILVPSSIAKAIWWLIRRTLPAIKLIVLALYWGVILLIKFVKYLFILIHSDLRLLCAMDAVIGAIIGFSASNALIGALAGGVIGVLNFELISKRLLHLVPSR